MRTTVHLPDDLLKRAKKKAADEGRTLTSLIEEGLRSVLAPKSMALGGKRKRLPISSVTGKVLPDVDLSSNAALQELLDDDVRQADQVKLK